MTSQVRPSPDGLTQTTCDTSTRQRLRHADDPTRYPRRMWPAASVTLVLIAACLFAGPSVAAGRAQPPSGRIVGDVRVCNGPGHCLTRIFHVFAIDNAGHVVSDAFAPGPDNRYPAV